MPAKQSAKPATSKVARTPAAAEIVTKAPRSAAKSAGKAIRNPVTKSAPKKAMTPAKQATTKSVKRAVSVATAPQSAESQAKQIDGFIDKLSPENAKLTRALRAALRKRFPTAVEMIYDNYNFLVFGFCSEPRAGTCIISLAVAANGAGLCFIHGASLPDPEAILSGSGKQTRFVRLANVSKLEEPAVATLMQRAVDSAKVPLPTTGTGITIIQSISAKQRPRKRS